MPAASQLPGMMWMLPLYLHVNQKSDDDDGDDDEDDEALLMSTHNKCFYGEIRKY